MPKKRKASTDVRNDGNATKKKKETKEKDVETDCGDDDSGHEADDESDGGKIFVVVKTEAEDKIVQEAFETMTIEQKSGGHCCCMRLYFICVLLSFLTQLKQILFLFVCMFDLVFCHTNSSNVLFITPWCRLGNSFFTTKPRRTWKFGHLRIGGLSQVSFYFSKNIHEKHVVCASVGVITFLLVITYLIPNPKHAP